MSSRLENIWQEIRHNGLVPTMAVLYDLNYFDYKFGIETRAPLQVQELDISNEQKSEANKYTCINWLLLRKCLRLLPIDLTASVFVNIGCGKGKALVIAGQFPFRRLVGVEFSPSLVRLCRENMRKTGWRTGPNS